MALEELPKRGSSFAAEITIFDDVIVVYKAVGDLMFYVTGGQEENELILYQVLLAFYESISLLLRLDMSRPKLTCRACFLLFSLRTDNCQCHG